MVRKQTTFSYFVERTTKILLLSGYISKACRAFTRRGGNLPSHDPRVSSSNNSIDTPLCEKSNRNMFTTEPTQNTSSVVTVPVFMQSLIEATVRFIEHSQRRYRAKIFIHGCFSQSFSAYCAILLFVFF